MIVVRIYTSVLTMASALASAAHNLAASFLVSQSIQPGASIPSVDVKEDSPDKASPLVLTGKNIIVRHHFKKG